MKKNKINFTLNKQKENKFVTKIFLAVNTMNQFSSFIVYTMKKGHCVPFPINHGCQVLF